MRDRTLSACKNLFSHPLHLQDFFPGAIPLHDIFCRGDVVMEDRKGKLEWEIFKCRNLNLDTCHNLNAWKMVQAQTSIRHIRVLLLKMV